jgi:hypothetical protein
MDEQQSGFLDDDPEYEDLLNQVEQLVKGWQPEPGDKLVGKVVDIDTARSEWGEYPLITVETSSGTHIGVHCFHQVVRNNVERKMAQGILTIGADIAFKYFGEGEAKGGNNAPNMYRVAVRPAKQ